MPVSLAESTPLVEAASGTPKSRKFRARLIAGGIQGSSGFYPASMLQECAGVFAESTPVYIDHPSMSESVDRPERSVRDLAGRLTSPAVYERDGLYADIEVYPHMAPVIEAMWGDIGMSIRASGTVEASDQEGVRGPIVTAITAAESVDFVTAAGAGGKIVALLESARANAPTDLPTPTPLAEARNVGQWLEARLHLTFTQLADDMFGNGRLTREERIALSSAIGDGLAAFVTRVEADQPQLYQRDLWDEPDGPNGEIVEAAPSKTTDPPQAEPVIENAPGSPPADKKEGEMPELTEAEARELTEAKTKLETDLAEARATAEAERTKFTEAIDALVLRVTATEGKLTEADARNLHLENDSRARAQVAEALRTSGLFEGAHARVAESVCRDLPTDDGGVLDATVLAESIAHAIDAEKTYLASVAEASGAGQPRGLGSAPQASDEPLSEADFNTKIAESFQRLGMNSNAAKFAASGRR